ncbi:MAG: dynamin family protein [Stigonema ocellatum SAG 48.90 = DSM 106950]|nr:dynamin family protein [Stigonema ocellatum SAG 48.90 = DSM 106950]
MTHQTFEQLQALTGCDDHLQFVVKVIEKVHISESVRVGYEQQIQRIQRRRTDPNFYLAVIGEFSSGKSTFINALLRDDLLKTSALIATSAATKLRYGDNINVEVIFQGSKAGTLKTKNNAKQITIPWLAGVNGIDIRQFIHIVTSKDEVAKDVVDLTITHPAPFLANGIVIIDTPGTNAINPQHAEITRQVVENEADAALIIIPATVPLSQTLVGFLATFLRPYLHRCIFVVTRMDQIRPQEQSEVLTNLRSRLVKQLAIKSPMLYACGAQVLMDMLTDGETVREPLKVWADRFPKLESIIIHRLRQERSHSIAESLLRLLTQLFEQLNTHLQDQWHHYKMRQAAIEQQTIPDLPSFAAQEHTICHQMLQDAVSATLLKVVQCVEQHKQKTISQIRDTIFTAENGNSLKKIVQSEAEQILNDHQHSLLLDLQRDLEQISQTAIEVGRHFDRQFSEAYHRLQTLGGSVSTDHHGGGGVQLSMSDVFSSIQLINTQMDNTDNNITGGMGTAGAVIGNILLPGVGIFLGGFLGVMAAGLVISLDVRKQKLWEQLRPNLDTYFDTAKAQAQQEIKAYSENVTQALHQRIDTYVAHYQVVVDEMLNDQKKELQRLFELQESIQTDLLEIDQRRKSLSANQQKLAENTF